MRSTPRNWSYAGVAIAVGVCLAAAACSSSGARRGGDGGTMSPSPITTCATMATPDMAFSGPGMLDTSTTAAGAAYGQASCPDLYLVELDLTQSVFHGRDLFVAGVWTPTVAATPCDETGTMDVFVFDGATWKALDVVGYVGVGGGGSCRPHAQSHTDSGSAGLDGTKIPAAMNFQKARLAVGASEGSTKLPVLISVMSL